jgi:hypothetical protein
MNTDRLTQKNLFVICPLGKNYGCFQSVPNYFSAPSLAGMYSIKSEGVHSKALQRLSSSWPSVRGISSVLLSRETLLGCLLINAASLAFVMRFRAINSLSRHLIKILAAKTFSSSVQGSPTSQNDPCLVLTYPCLVSIFRSARWKDNCLGRLVHLRAPKRETSIRMVYPLFPFAEDIS